MKTARLAWFLGALTLSPMPAIAQGADVGIDDQYIDKAMQKADKELEKITPQREQMYDKLKDYRDAHPMPGAAGQRSLDWDEHGIGGGEVYWYSKYALVIRRAYFDGDGKLICDHMTSDGRVLQTLISVAGATHAKFTNSTGSNGSYISHATLYDDAGNVRAEINFDQFGTATKGDIFDAEKHRTGSWVSNPAAKPPTDAEQDPCPPRTATQVRVTEEKTNKPVSGGIAIVQPPHGLPQIAKIDDTGKASVSTQPGDKITVDTPGNQPVTTSAPRASQPVTPLKAVKRPITMWIETNGGVCPPIPEDRIRAAEEAEHVKINRANLPKGEIKPGGFCEYRITDFQPEDPPSTQTATNEPADTAQPRKGQLRPNDPLLSFKGDFAQWWARAIGLISADGASVVPERGAPVVVAVVDTGVDFTHPELSGAMWINEREVPGNGRDDDGNGFVDDFAGWNFIAETPDVRDDNGHGTVVAGIIAARANNGYGIAGINPWAKIMSVKVNGHNNRGDSIKLAKGIIYAADNGARVINVSVGGPRLTNHERLAIDYATRKGALVVVAAGNEGIDIAHFSPASVAGALTVAAVNHDLHRSGYSNWGANVAIAAPGDSIVSLHAHGTDLMMFEDAKYEPGSDIVDGAFYQVSGTSFAAPMVAGAASLLMSVNPRLTAAEVKRVLLQSAHDIDVPGRDQNTGYGLLDLAAALKADPAFYVDTAIAGLAVIQKDGKQAVRVSGTATANKFKSAWVEIGSGDDPKTWTKVGSPLSHPVSDGVIADLDASSFRAAKHWTIRLITEHANGERREARIVLNLG